MTVLVSVVITTIGNNCVYRSIEKVLNQSYKNIEILVMYDGAQFREFKMKFEGEGYSNTKLFNVGPFNNANHARNCGIELSKGLYIALLDDDDFWDEDHIENLVNYSKNILNDKFLLLTGSKVYSETKGVIKKVPSNFCLDNRKNISKILFCENGFMQTSSYFFSKKLSEKIKFDENLRMHQDYDWLLKIEKHDTDIYVKQLDLYTNYYSCDANSNSVSKKSKIIDSANWCFLAINDDYYKYCFLNKISTNFLCNAKSNDLIIFLGMIIKYRGFSIINKMILSFRSLFLYIKSIFKKFLSSNGMF